MSTPGGWVDAVRRIAANTPPSETIRPPDPTTTSFATVRSLSPLRIALDGDPANVVPFAPACIIYPSAVGQRVLVATFGTQLVILGPTQSGPPKAWGCMWKTNGFQNPPGVDVYTPVTMDWQNAVLKGGIGAQGGEGNAGELMIKKAAWYRCTAKLYLTGSGTGLSHLEVNKWYGSFSGTGDQLGYTRTTNANDEMISMVGAPRWFESGTNLRLKFDGPTHTWGNADRSGTFLCVEEI